MPTISFLQGIHFASRVSQTIFNALKYTILFLWALFLAVVFIDLIDFLLIQRQSRMRMRMTG